MYYCDFSVDGFLEYNNRLQILLLFFINGASFIEEDHNWRIYLLYKKEGGVHILVGFTTIYAFFREIKTCRYRISQFLILPPYQRKGLGMHLISVKINMKNNNEFLKRKFIMMQSMTTLATK